MVDCKIRSVAVIRNHRTGQSFQLVFYGMKENILMSIGEDVGGDLIRKVLERRGWNTDLWIPCIWEVGQDHTVYKDDQPRRYPQSAEDRYRQHFFSPRI